MHAPTLLALGGAGALLALRDEGSTDTNGREEGILLAGIVEENKSLFLGPTWNQRQAQPLSA